MTGKREEATVELRFPRGCDRWAVKEPTGEESRGWRWHVPEEPAWRLEGIPAGVVVGRRNYRHVR